MALIDILDEKIIDLEVEGDAFYHIAQTELWHCETLQKLESTETRPALAFCRLSRKKS